MPGRWQYEVQNAQSGHTVRDALLLNVEFVGARLLPDRLSSDRAHELIGIVAPRVAPDPGKHAPNEWYLGARNERIHRGVKHRREHKFFAVLVAVPFVEFRERLYPIGPATIRSHSKNPF